VNLPRAGLVAALVATFAFLAASTWLPAPRDAMTASLCGYGIAFVVYGAALYTQHRRGTLRLRDVLIAAALARVALLASSVHFSDDVWRYLWDGIVQLEGINPYIHAPESEALAPLRDAVIWPAVNHKWVPTIYPPVAQIVFALNAAVGGSVTGLRLVMIAAEAAMLPAVWRLVGAHSPRARAWTALLLTWNPLMVVEFAGSAHLDVLAITPLLWALALARDLGPRALRSWALAGIALGLSIAAKLIGIIALPALLWYLWRRGTRRVAVTTVMLATVLGTLLVTFLPYQTTILFSESGSFTSSLSTYARKWRFNDGLFRALTWSEGKVLQRARGADGGDPSWDFSTAPDPLSRISFADKNEAGDVVRSARIWRNELEIALAKAVAAGILGLLLLFCLNQRFSPSGTTLTMLMGAFLLAPVVHPWYVAWLVPLAVVHRNRSALVWSALVLLSYHAAWLRAAEGEWRELDWPPWVEYAPVVGIAVWEGFRRLTTDFDVRRMPAYAGDVHPAGEIDDTDAHQGRRSVNDNDAPDLEP
jgi:alpha-1,6-mannosyltransferase